MSKIAATTTVITLAMTVPAMAQDIPELNKFEVDMAFKGVLDAVNTPNRAWRRQIKEATASVGFPVLPSSPAPRVTPSVSEESSIGFSRCEAQDGSQLGSNKRKICEVLINAANFRLSTGEDVQTHWVGDSLYTVTFESDGTGSWTKWDSGRGWKGRGNFRYLQ
jgi:hypothetical protein